MTNNDKIIRDRLYQMEAPYPSDMWEKIAANLPNEKDDKKLWLFFLLFILAMVVPGSMYWFKNNNINTSMKTNTVLPSVPPINYTETYIAEKENEDLSTVKAPEENNIQPIINLNKKKSKKDLTVNILDNQNDSNPLSKGYIQHEIKNIENENISNPAEENVAKNKVDPFVTKALIAALYPLENVPSLLQAEDYNFIPPDCPTFGFNSSRGLYIDFVYSHDYGMKQLEAKSQEFSPYITERENTESSLYSFSAGVRIAYISSSGLGLKTGFNYSQINEKFEYIDPDASLIRTIITIDTLIVGGVPTVISDTSTIRIPGSLDITVYNKYRFFDIPILATYESYLTDKIYYTLNGGVLLNLAFSQKGRFLDPGGQPVWFTSSEPDRYDAYKMSAGISLFGSIGLHYYLTPHIDLIVEPNFKMFTGSLTNDVYPLKQKWVTGGLITGIRYKF